MDKLPNVEPDPEPEPEVVNTEIAPPPQIEVIVNEEEDVVPQEQIFKDSTPAPALKKKRKPTQAQLDNLAKMREKRAENRLKAKEEKIAKIPQNATPVKKTATQIQSAPPMPSMSSAEGFLNFMDYMEKYKTIKDNWKKREIEKAKKYVAKQEPKSVPEKKPEIKTVKKTPTPKPTLLTNHSTSNNTYSDYF